VICAGQRLGMLTRAAEAVPRLTRWAWPTAGVGVASLVVAYLVSSGLWFVAAGLLFALPAFVLIHRRPMIGITLWLLVAPLVSITDSTGLRMLYWLVHRAMPIGVLAIVLVSSRLGIHRRTFPRLGWPEVMMLGYLGASLLSVAYTSVDPVTNAILVYDRVFIPMCLYLLVRLLEPDRDDVKLLVPAAAFILLTQSAIAVLSWAAPGVLPDEWLNKLGERTTGSLGNADLFGVTVLFCGMFLLHRGLCASRRLVGQAFALPLFTLSLTIVFLTFSRATWLAGTVALLGLLWLYPRFVRRFVGIMAPVIILVLASGVFAWQIQFAQQRLRSEEAQYSALSRLPVAFASIRMVQARPVFGWGYENFDRFDYGFQRRVGNLIYPQEDHASHNLYLTILAEQGMVGFLLFLGPAVFWLVRTRSVWARVPPTGLVSRKLLGILWVFLATHVVINNFVRMQVPFGFGMWWLTLGLIGSIVARYGREPETEA
jgi:O-antigen ligase